MKLKAARFIASCGGLGYSRFMPGTVGSFGALAVCAALRFFVPFSVVVAFGLVATFLGFFAVKELVGSSSNDPAWIVIDEWCAIWFLSCAVPLTFSPQAVAFLLFRLLDITKVWPVSVGERASGVWGVFLDDFIAAFSTAIFLYCTGIPAIL